MTFWRSEHCGVFVVRVNSPRGPCGLACAPLYAEDSFRDHEGTNKCGMIKALVQHARGNETPLIHLRRTSFSARTEEPAMIQSKEKQLQKDLSYSPSDTRNRPHEIDNPNLIQQESTNPKPAGKKPY